MALVRYLLLTVLLVFGQLGAVAHTLGHFSHRSDDGNAAGEAVCEQCLLYSHFGAAAPAGGSDCLPPFAPALPSAAAIAPTAVSASLHAYLSRAPPLSSSNQR